MADEQKLSDLLIEWDEQRRSGSEPSIEELCRDCPELADEVASRIQSLKQTDWLFADDTDDSFLSLPVGRVQRDEDSSDAPTDAIDLPETTLTADEFVAAVVESTLLTADDLQPVRDSLGDDPSAAELARELLWVGQLTVFQASSLLEQTPLPLVLGDYEILDRIGAGGMGEVYKARHRRMKRVVALKILPHELTDDEAALKRFNREVEIVARLEHANIVTAHDAGEQNGTHYLIMQFVDGCDLTTLIRSSGVLPVEQAVDFTLQAARGLAHAHSEGVIHRDIKPSNLLVDTRGRVKILDLGLARVDVPAAQQIENRDGLTTTGAVMGTIDYMAPEQAVNTRTADHRSDIYSLGCTLHFLLTGNPPYGGETMMERLLAHREQPTPSLQDKRDDVPTELDTVFHKLLAKQPADRFTSMADVVTALEPLVGRVQRGSTSDTDDSATTALPHSVRPTDDVGRVQRGDSHTNSETRLVNLPAVAVAEQQSELQIASPDDTLNQSTVNTDPSLAETVIKPAADSSRRSGRFKWIALAVLLLGTAFYAASPLFKVKTRGGTLVFDGDPSVLEIASVTIDGDQVDLEFDGKEYTVDVDKDSGKVRIETSDGTELLATDFTFKVGENRLPLSISSRPHAMRQASTNTSPHSVRPTDPAEPYNTPAQHRALAEFLREHGATFSLRYEDDGKWSGYSGKPSKDTQLPDRDFYVHEIQGQNWIPVDRAREYGELLKRVRVYDLQFSESANGVQILSQIPTLEAENNLKLGFSDDAVQLLRSIRTLQLGFGGVPRSLEAIRHLSQIASVKTFSLNATEVSDECLQYLPSMNLEDVKLTRTNVTEDGVKALAKALPNCRIEWDGGVVEPRETTDRHVAEWLLSVGVRAIYGRTASGEAFNVGALFPGSALSDRYFQITSIDLHENKRITDTDLTRFKGLSELEVLQLPHTRVTDNGLAQLTDLMKLHTLFLHGTEITDAGLQYVCQLSGLKTLYLSDHITDEGLRALVRLPKLRVLNLGMSPITDTGLDHIAGYSNLYHLDLRISPFKASSLSKLKAMQGLTFLALNGTDIADPEIRELSKALPKCHILWDGGEIKPTRIEDVCAWVTSRGCVCSLSDGTPVRSKTELPAGQNIYAIQLPNATDAEIETLRQLPSLESLDLRGGKLTGAGFVHLQNRKDLRMLFLSDNESLVPQYLPHLKSLSLEYFRLLNTPLGDEAAELAAQFPNLVDFAPGQAITAEGLAAVSQSKTISMLDISNCPQLRPEDFSVLTNLQSLQMLTLSINATTPETIASLAAIPHLHTITWDGNSNDIDGEIFAPLKQVKNISLGNVGEGLDDKDVAALSELKQLESLNIAGTSVTQTGIDRLRTSLPNCRIEWDGGVIEPK